MPARTPDLDDAQLDLVFRALGDRTRRALLTRLSQGSARVTELAEPFEMSLPAVSRHVRVLERAGLVNRDVRGRVHQCSLDVAALGDAEQWLQHYRAFWSGALDFLAQHVERDEP